MFHYRLFGLNIQLPIQHDLLQKATGEPDVAVEFAPIPDTVEFGPQQFLLTVKDVARYYISNGNRIQIDVLKDAPVETIRLFLLGSAMGCLLHQRALLVLHGCSVAFDEGIVVFVADSGTGKSTLASHFYKAQFPIYSDDQTVVDVPNRRLVSPGLGQIKLWDAILDEQGFSKAGLDKVHASHEKYIFPIDQSELQPKPLLAVVELTVGQDYLFEPLNGSAKLEMLVKHTYRNQYLAKLHLLKQHFIHCGEIANSVLTVRATRPSSTPSSKDFFEFLLQQLELQGIHRTAHSVVSD